jgi:NSS family neurotransmitter:Na+ symporter
VEIFDADGGLIAGPGLIISVLPALFDNMGAIGGVVAFAFFALMTIASLTSSISMLEVPVAFVVERREVRRPIAAAWLGAAIGLISLIIVWNFDALFDWVVTATTEWSQPLLGLFFCVFAGWIWNRAAILKEIQQGSPDAASGFFWKIWPTYIRFVCPLAILAVYLQ